MPPTSKKSRSSSGCLRWAAMGVIVFLVILGALTSIFFNTLQDAAAWLRDLPTRLVHQDISTTFRQSITEIASTKGDILEVATMQTDETVTKFDMKSAFNEAVYLGTTISEIRTPVVYRYHIKLSEDWQLSLADGVCTVRGPSLRPTLPPAIRTEGMEKKSEAGWLRFNAAENLAALEKELTPTLEKRAGNKAHLDLVREAARKSVAEFVKNWLLKEGKTHQGDVRSIVVLFQDEAQTSPAAVPPTLLIQ
ncbi:MAG: hypothetical protein NTV80_09135 [Verrucomicrobia bacterium]|nr:hypothetical protein [Verrucomicrobiota bacterium]